MPIPDSLRGGLRVFGVFYPKYRLFVLATGILIFSALLLLLHRTRLGALIRAGVDDPEMVEASGINIRRVFLVTFVLGSALAGFGGLMGGAFLSLYPSADAEILVFSLAVVIIGGRGSIVGAAIAQPAGRPAQHARPGDVSGTRLFRDFRSDGVACWHSVLRPVGTARVMTIGQPVVAAVASSKIAMSRGRTFGSLP